MPSGGGTSVGLKMCDLVVRWVGYRVAKRRPWNNTLMCSWSVLGQRLFRQTRVARDRKTGHVVFKCSFGLTAGWCPICYS